MYVYGTYAGILYACILYVYCIYASMYVHFMHMRICVHCADKQESTYGHFNGSIT